MSGEKDLRKIRVADFSDPKPFKTTRGAFHSYTYIPLLGWLPPAELNILIAVAAVSLAVALPQRGLERRLLYFLIVPASLAALAGAVLALAWAASWVGRRGRRPK